MLLTAFLTTREGWPRGKPAEPTFKSFRYFYRSVLVLGLNATVVYDSLPQELIQRYSTPSFRFVKASLEGLDPRFGASDVRYFLFDRLLRSHDDWRWVFLLDAFDVRVKRNPCGALNSRKLYVGSETVALTGDPWMKARFAKLGGLYSKWYMGAGTSRKTLNCGIIGGHRDLVRALLSDMTATLQDPETEVRRRADEPINVAQAALNYNVYCKYAGRLASGEPLHSVYRAKEVRRDNVWFVHK